MDKKEATRQIKGILELTEKTLGDAVSLSISYDVSEDLSKEIQDISEKMRNARLIVDDNLEKLDYIYFAMASTQAYALEETAKEAIKERISSLGIMGTVRGFVFEFHKGSPVSLIRYDKEGMEVGRWKF